MKDKLKAVKDHLLRNRGKYIVAAAVTTAVVLVVHPPERLKELLDSDTESPDTQEVNGI